MKSARYRAMKKKVTASIGKIRDLDGTELLITESDRLEIVDAGPTEIDFAATQPTWLGVRLVMVDAAHGPSRLVDSDGKTLTIL